jgi:para-nitrobenzyl esterase
MEDSNMNSQATIQPGRLEGLNTGGIHIFLGIPYAKPPVGPLRWRPPDPPDPWEGVRLAKQFGPIAIQTTGACFNLRETRQSEDCLSLNIWTASLDREALQPVMLWIHGGENLGGAGSEDAYDGASLARRSVTVVTINYRFGVFGFLAHPDAGANFAALDFLAVLEWIAQNIRAFGGNPDNVTVFGQSAGAQAVRTLLSMRRARGLFHRGIMQSGGFEPSAIAQPWTFARTQAATERLMQMVGAKTMDDLRKVPTGVLRKASQALCGVSGGGIHTPADLMWVSVPDELVDASGFPGWGNDVPIMFGCTENEARYFVKPGGPRLPFPKNIAITLHNFFKPGGSYSRTTVEKITTLLCGAHGPQVTDILRQSGKTPYECLDWLITEIVFREPALQTVHRFATLRRPFYCYNFARASPGERISRNLALHTAEIRYVFGNLTTDGQYDKTDQVISDAMQSAWTAFANTGVPKVDWEAAWPSVDMRSPQYMSIEDEFMLRPYVANELTRLIASMRSAPCSSWVRQQESKLGKRRSSGWPPYGDQCP